MQKYSASQVSKQSNHFLLNILMIAIVIISNFGGMVSPAKAEAPVMEIRESSPANENGKGGLLKNTSQNRGVFALPTADSSTIVLDANLECVPKSGTGWLCSSDTPNPVYRQTISFGSINLKEVHNLNIVCTGNYCHHRDIYYRFSVTLNWASDHERDIKLSLYVEPWRGRIPKATGAIIDYPCGKAETGSCTLSTSGVLPANAMYNMKDPNYSDYDFSFVRGVKNYGTGDVMTQTITVEASYDPSLLTNSIPTTSTFPACGQCDPSTYSGTFLSRGDPINTRTGVFTYPSTDLSFQSGSGSLEFERNYISFFHDKNLSALGNGWTHNHDIRLVFSSDSLGKPGFVLFKHPSGNLYQFWDKGNGIYTPYAGLLSSLARSAASPYTYTITEPSGNSYHFDSTGKITSWEDDQNHTISYNYDANGRLEQVSTDNGTRYLDFEYNQQNFLESVSDHTNRTITYGYDLSGNLNTVTNVLGQSWQYEYDTDHRLLRVLDSQLRQVVRNTYYPSTDPFAGRIYQQYDGNDNLVVALAYNTDGSTTIQDGLGNTSTDAYNETGVLVETSDPNLLSSTSKTYDHNFRPETVTDALGNETELDWSDDGADLTSFTDAAGNDTTITYLDHKPQTITGPNGVVTTYTYDSNLLSSVITAGQATSYTYYTTAPRQGLLETIQDPSGMVTKYEYDVHGQQTKVIANYDPNHGENEAGLYNLTTKYEYDELGRVTMISTPSGKAEPAWVVSYSEYDDAGNLVLSVQNYNPDFSENHPDLYNLTTHYIYDVRGRQIAVQDTYGSITRTYYDNADRVVAVVRNLALAGRTAEAAIADENIPARGSAGQGMNLRSDYEYDLVGNLIATIDEKGITTRTYNQWDTETKTKTVTVVRNLTGQSTSVPTPPVPDPSNPSEPDENRTSQTISDANGNVIGVIDESGIKTRTYYDELNRPKLVVQNLTQDIALPTPPECGSADSEENLCSETFYDVSGNVIATRDSLGIYTRTYYDQLNRPIRVVQNLVGQSYQVNWLEDEYCGQTDENGNVSINICTNTQYDDDSGRVIASQDERGQITRTYYDAAGRVATVVRNLTGQDVEIDTPPARAAGAADENIRTDTEYDGAGRRSLTTDPLGRQVQYEYDLLGRLSKTTVNPWPEQPQNYQGPVSDEYYNLVTTYTYDALGRTLTTTDTAGNISSSEYDPQSGLLLSSSRNNLQTVYHYDLFGRQIAVTDPQGSTTRSYFDDLGRTVDTVRNLSNWEISNPIPPVGQTSNEINLRSSVVYGSNGQVKESIATDGTVTEYEYDDLGRQTSTTTPPLPGIRSVYDSLGRLVMSIAPSSDPDLEEVVTRYAYDAQGRLTDVWENYRPGYTENAETNVHTQYTYDAGSNRLTIRDGNEHVTTFTYDKLGRLWTETDALGHTWTYSYDKNSNRTALLDANGATTQYEYNTQGRLVGIDYPAPDADVAFEYDVLGRRTEMQEGLGTTTWANYTDLNQPTSITDPFGDTVTYAYDDFGKRSGLTYPDSGMVVSYDFDQAQRPNLVTRDQSQAAEYVYDMLGRVQNINLANGVVSQYNYSEAGQLESIVHLDGEQELASYHYEYYDNGNRSQAVENVYQPNIEQTPIFNDVSDGWKKPYIEAIYQAGISEGCGNGNYCPTNSTNRAEAAILLLKAKHGSSYTPPPATGTVFDDVPVDHWAAAWIEQLAAEGITEGCDADSYCPSDPTTNDQVALFLLRAKYGSSYAPPAVGDSTGFTDVPVDYWAAAWIKQLAAENIAESCSPGNYCPTLAVSRENMAVLLVRTFQIPLENPNPTPGSSVTVTIDYEYDPLNRLTKATYTDPNNPGAGVRMYEYTYDAVGNRLSQTVTIDGLAAVTLYEYDAANRLTSAGGQTYTYDNNGNLLSDGANTYSYDAANRLISVTSSQGAVTSYAYNGLGDRLQEAVDGITTTFTMDLNTGLTQALSDGEHEYLYGAGRIAQVDTETLNTEYFLTDALGSVRQLINQTGAVTFAQTYDPYGVLTASTGSSASGYGFTGEYQQDGLVYLRARHYAPGMGRFLTRDTWSGDANRPLSFNRWGYVEGNPVNLTDPSGNYPIIFPEAKCIQLAYLATQAATELGMTMVPDYNGMCYVEKLMSPDPNDFVNTYVAAGVAIESNAYSVLVDTRGGLYWRTKTLEHNYMWTGLGICNVSDIQMNTAYGKKINETGGYGLGLYGMNQEQPGVAVRAMKRRIQLVINNPDKEFKCKDCSATDIFIAAALAEGSNIFQSDIKILVKEYRAEVKSLNGVTLRWIDYLTNNNILAHNLRQIKLFAADVKELNRRDADWAIDPDLNWRDIELISNGVQP